MTEPMYRRIAQDLREQIKSGALAPGDQLPTEPQLRDRYGASRNTIREAIGLLVRDGLAGTKPGQGTFVARRLESLVIALSAPPLTGLKTGEAHDAFAEAGQRGRTSSASAPRVEVQSADGAIA